MVGGSGAGKGMLGMGNSLWTIWDHQDMTTCAMRSKDPYIVEPL